MTPPNCSGPSAGLHALPLVGDDADRHAAEPAVAAHQRLAVLRLVLVERGRVEDARQQVADVVLLPRLA